MILEVACFSVEDAILASRAGADRIELCSSYEKGGLYPGKENLEKLLDQSPVPVVMMIRPRAGDFVYNTNEIEMMESQIRECIPYQPSAFIFGALTNTHEVDKGSCDRLLKVAGSVPCVFHRAIDQCKDISASVETLADLGFKRVLSSGGREHAYDGIETLMDLSQKFGNRLEIMPGGGIRSHNSSLFNGFSSIHSACRLHDALAAEEIRKIKSLVS